MKTLRNLTAQLLASSALVALVAGVPATVDFDSDFSQIAIKPNLAMAKGENSGSGSGGSGGGNDDSGGSGSGGSGSGDDDDDDDDDDSDDDDDIDDDDDNDDDEDEEEDNASETPEQEFTTADGTKIEVNGDNIEVKFANGWKEEIEDGRFEMKDPAGNTVVERPATEEDRARLEQQIPN